MGDDCDDDDDDDDDERPIIPPCCLLTLFDMEDGDDVGNGRLPLLDADLDFMILHVV